MRSVIKWLLSTILGLGVTGLIGAVLLAGAAYPEVMLIVAGLFFIGSMIALAHEYLWS